MEQGGQAAERVAVRSEARSGIKPLVVSEERVRTTSPPADIV